MRKLQHGFTLLEIMLVIAIIAIMLTFAIPMYLDYSARAKVTECLSLQAPVKLKISESVIDEHAMPQPADVLPNRITDPCEAGTYVRTDDDFSTLIINIDEEALGVSGEVVQARLDAHRCTNDDVEWACYYASSGGDTTQGRYLPLSCRTTVVEFSESCG